MTKADIEKMPFTLNANQVAEILGVAAAEVVPMTAVVHCSGDCEATEKAFLFDGVQSCKAVKRFYGGSGMCKYGCIGLGDCISVCEHDAIKIVNGVAKVNPVLCGACGQCAAVCPNQLITVKPVSKRIDVMCSSGDNGKATKLVCKNGCIGCKICEKKCPNEAIIVNNFHASINYTLCTNCGICMEACPARLSISAKMNKQIVIPRQSRGIIIYPMNRMVLSGIQKNFCN